MDITTALQGMSKHREALEDESSVSNPTYISENTHRLAQYISVVEERLADLEAELELKESKDFNDLILSGKSANAAKEISRRGHVKEKVEVVRLTRLVSSAWKLVSESQSRVKHLIAEANNQI